MDNSDNPNGPEATGVASAAHAIEALLTKEDGDSEPNQEADLAELGVPKAVAADDEEIGSGGEREEEEAESGAENQPDTHTVKVDGREVEVTVDELKAGYSRTADYTRKTMAVAEERKALEQQSEDLAKERAQYRNVLDIWKQQLNQTFGKEAEAELEQLRVSNPAEYAARIADRQEQQKRLSAIMAEQQRAIQEDSSKRVAQAAQGQAAAGLILQANEQAKLDAAYQQWLNAWYYPLQQQEIRNASLGLFSVTGTTTSSGTSETQRKASFAEIAGGIGSILGGASGFHKP